MKHDGDKGFVILDGAATSAAGDRFAYLQALKDSVIDFDVLARPGMGANAETSVSSLAVPAGVVVNGGIFHNLDQASGLIMAYYK